MSETSGGAPFGLTLREYQAIQVQETERRQRMEAMRKATWKHLTVDLGEVMEALDDHDPDAVWVLDLETGEAVCFTEEERRDDPEEPWEDLDRYLCIHPLQSHESFEFMTDFVENLPTGKPRKTLEQALSRRHPFRAFKDALLAYPNLREAWFKYHDDCLRSEATAWIGANLKGANIRNT
jgi:hypothetical protein